MHSHPQPGAARNIGCVAGLVLALALNATQAHSDEPVSRHPDGIVSVSPEAQFRALQKLKWDMLWQTARRKFAAARAAADEARAAKRPRAGHAATATQPRRSSNVKPAPQDLLPVPMTGPVLPAPLAAGSTTVIPPNVRVNNPASDAAGVGQAEESIAAWGNYVVVAFNDGQGFSSGGDQQGIAWSVDGGATFTDGTPFPKPVGFPAWKWTSDPVLTVNEKTGRFYYCGLADPDASTNAIGVVAFTLGPGGPVFDPVRIVRSAAKVALFLDKPWIAADSASGRLYVSHTAFAATNQIDFQWSGNDGASWSLPAKLSAASDDGNVQGSRIVIGPPAGGLGRVHAVWSAIGQTTNEDYFRYRASTTGGATFGTQSTAASYIANFGTGAPAFNRERGVHFPSLAADRTFGPNRGRLYLAWNESYNHLDDSFNNPIVKTEVEANGTPGQATPFTIGSLLRGATSSVSPGDLDYWSFPMTAGQHVIFWVDSLPDQQTYTLRLFAPVPNDNQRLAYGGDVIAGSTVNNTYYTFSAPASGTYYLRFSPAFSDANSRIGPYRIRTKAGVRGSERGRDQRDVFASTSSDGVGWTAPVRVNDDLPGFDDYLPEVAVGADGCPYVTWRDHRDDPYGTRTHQYLARSTDGGATWSANQRVTDAQSNFTTSASNIAPNLGDYNALFGDGRWMRAAWADGRGATVDVWSTRIDTDFSLSGGPAPQQVAPGQLVTLAWSIDNHHPLFENGYTLSAAAARHWPAPAPGAAVAPANASGPASITLAIPDTAAAGPVAITLATTAARSTQSHALVATLIVNPALLAAGSGAPAFSLRPVVPTPSRGQATIGFSLGSGARVRLTVHDLQGKRVRTLLEAEPPAGSHQVTWDGRDEHGAMVPAGTYFYRLESAGRVASRRLVWMR